jgi:hypothetical protein
VAGVWRTLHNEEVCNLYTSPHIIRVMNSTRMRWVGHIAHMGELRNAYKILVGKPEGKTPVGSYRNREGEAVDWIYLPHDRDQWRADEKKVMNLWVP